MIRGGQEFKPGLKPAPLSYISPMNEEVGSVFRLKVGLIQIVFVGGLVFLSKWTFAILSEAANRESGIVAYLTLSLSVVLIFSLLATGNDLLKLLQTGTDKEGQDMKQECEEPSGNAFQFSISDVSIGNVYIGCSNIESLREQIRTIVESPAQPKPDEEPPEDHTSEQA